MRILMMTNTYEPVIGGIEQSIHSFSEEFRRQGHKVAIVAPTFEGMREHEKDVIRIPAIQNFLRDDVSLTLPIPIFLSHFMKEFQPDIIHSHHFFGVGDTALRLARKYHIPLVFTHHIMLDQYADFFPIHNERVKRFVLRLATGYANLTDAVIAPSHAVSEILHRDGVKKPIHIIPTGVDVKRFAEGNGKEFRKKRNISENAFVLGFVGRLNPEKNLEFLARAASRFLKQNRKAHCLMIGEGPLKETIKDIFTEFGVEDRLHCTGALHGQDLVNAYHATDLFIFSSHSETQGIVLIESMSCGTPVAVIDAPAVRELVKDGKNGRLIAVEDEEQFVAALNWFTELNKSEWQNIQENAQATAAELSIEKCAERLLDVYLCRKLNNAAPVKEYHLWDSVKDLLKTEKDLLKNAVEATEAALKRN